MATEIETKASIDALTAAVAALKPALDAEKAAIADAVAKQKAADAVAADAEKAAFLDTVKAPVDAATAIITEVTPPPAA